MHHYERETNIDTFKMLRRQLDQLQDELPEITDDYHRIYLYFIGDQFENLPPTNIKICDGKDDAKIDFYHAGEDSFVAYQCKLPDLDLLEQTGKVKTYGADLINELEDILTFLTDEKGVVTAGEKALEARNRYRLRKKLAEDAISTYKLEASLAVFGRLTPPAKERLEELKRNWSVNPEEDSQFDISVIDFDQIETELNLSSSGRQRPNSIKLSYQSETQVNTNQWGYALVPAKDFYGLFDKHRMSLFDLNVRYYLKNSSINKQIIRTLTEMKGQKNFHLLNNGVTISCTGWNFGAKRTQNTDDTKFTLKNPQIINGCQTVISIYRAYNQIKDENLRRNFDKKCLVPVRIIKIDKNSDLLADIVTASNNQNKMAPRNLRSNDRIQRVLHRKFDQLPYRWFYERKDAEFNSVREYDKKFQDKHYQFSNNNYRIISNEDIAKTWLSFIGLSKDASERINAFDFDDDSVRYELLFGRRPLDLHWGLITLGPQVEIDEDNFEGLSPSPEQYLVSYIIFQFVKAYLPSPYANKKNCEERIIKSGKIKPDSPDEMKKQALMEDPEYVLNQILYNMKGVIVELFAWILIKAYGPFNQSTAESILNLPGFKDLIERPDFKVYAKYIGSESLLATEKQNHILFTGFEFIKEAVVRWKSVNESKYLSASRRIRFLHSAKTVEEMKYQMEQTNKNTAYMAYLWKPEVAYLESLPKL